mgnify:CR=1 FL=1
MEHVINGFKNAFNFTDRLSRKGYWYFVLATVGLQTIFYILSIVCTAMEMSGVAVIALALYLITAIISAIPSISAAARRLHDINKSGWTMLIGIVPIIGPLYLLYLVCLAGDKGDNRFGSPKN